MASVDSIERRLSVAELVLGVGEPTEHYVLVYCTEGDESAATERAIATYCEENSVDKDDRMNSFLALIYLECEEDFYLPGDPNKPDGWVPGEQGQNSVGNYVEEVKQCAKSIKMQDGISATNKELEGQGIKPESYGYRRKQ